MKRIYSFLFISFLSLPIFGVEGANLGKYDVVVLSAHPDDAVISSGGTIANFIKAGKKVAVIFFTNGEAGLISSSLNSSPITIGKKRQKEAVFSLTYLGLRRKDIFFLSYPDRGLMPIWRKEYKDKYFSPFIRKDFSPFKGWGKSKKGYTRENVIDDLVSLLSQQKPLVIYTHHLQDIHSDHKAVTLFLYKALKILAEKNPENSQWIYSADLRYYIVHKPKKRLPPVGLVKRDISSFWKKKQKALKFYKIGMQSAHKAEDLTRTKKEFYYSYKGDIKKILSKEIDYLAHFLRKKGYNMTMSVVSDIDDPLTIENPVSTKLRIFSNNPLVVSQMSEILCDSYNKNKILPVVKHFPGLKGAYIDTHSRLCSINFSLEEIKRELFPYKQLLKKGIDFAIMVSNAVYPAISHKPAVLSSKIIDLARNYLGFDGLLVTDEIKMGSLKDFYIKKYGNFDLVRAVVDCFNAGCDIVTIYLSRDNFKKEITEILEGLEKAWNKGEINKVVFRESVKRILKIKRKSLASKFKIDDLSLREQIAQKLLLEVATENQMKTVANLGIGAIHLRYPKLLKNIRFKIPPFIACMLEGGKVYEKGLDFNLEPALMRGFEYERLIEKHFSKQAHRRKEGKYHNLAQKVFDVTFIFERYKSILYREPLSLSEWDTFNFPFYSKRGLLKFNSYNKAPFEWIAHFKDEKEAKLAYLALEDAFYRWQKKFDFLNNSGDVRAQLVSFLQYIKSDKRFYIKRPYRILCLATHPDEEDGELISYLKDNFECKVYILYATYGEGGVDFLIKKPTSKLKFSRVLEAVRAAKKLKVEGVYFLGMPDFGYTSSEGEVKKYWNLQVLKKKLTYFLLNIKPDIIVTKNGPFSSHAQNRVFINTAFEVTNLLVRENKIKVRHFWQRRASNYDVLLAADKVSKNLGISYNQFAYEVLKLHRSQGSWSFQEKGRKYGPHFLYYKDLLHSNSKGYFIEGKLPREDNLELNISSFPDIKVIPQTKILLIGRDYNLKAILYMLGFFNVDVVSSDKAKAINWDDYDTVLFSPFYFQSQSDDWMIGKISNFINQGGRVFILNHYDINSKIMHLVSGIKKMKFLPIEDESSPFKILAPKNCLFRFPNKIGKEIFRGWKKQRALFVPQDYDHNLFKPLVSFYDKNRDAWVSSTLLVYKREKGMLIVSCLDFESQLLNLNKGVLKFFANCISKH